MSKIEKRLDALRDSGTFSNSAIDLLFNAEHSPAPFAAPSPSPEPELAKKYRDLKRKHQALDKAMREAIGDKDSAIREAKKWKFDVVKLQQQVDLLSQEKTRLQSSLIEARTTMNQLAEQAKRERDEKRGQ